MAVEPLRDEDQDLPAPQGHVIGFVDTEAQCHAITQALNAAGIPDSKITVFSGEDGVQLLKRMLGGSLWGETAEDVLRDGVIELENGHSALVIDAEGRDEAIMTAKIAADHGGRNFNHFGTFADERLTR